MVRFRTGLGFRVGLIGFRVRVRVKVRGYKKKMYENERKIVHHRKKKEKANKALQGWFSSAVKDLIERLG